MAKKVIAVTLPMNDKTTISDVKTQLSEFPETEGFSSSNLVAMAAYRGRSREMLDDQTICLSIPDFTQQEFLLFDVKNEHSDDMQVELNWLKLE